MQKLLTVLILSFVLTGLYGQKKYNYKITYDLTYQPDSTDASSKKKEKMFLYIGDETSRFSSAGKAIGASLQSTFDYSNFNQAAVTRMSIQIPEKNSEYYM